MKYITKSDISSLYIPPSDSHKGQNGKLLVIGGSHFFHAASLWALTVASRIVDLVHYASVPENNELVHQAKQEFRNGIVVPREDIERYIQEDDVILIGPGMVRKEQHHGSTVLPNNLEDILALQDEGEQTEALTNYVLQTYPQKQWVIDAGALQMVDIKHIPSNSILTPHAGEFDRLWEHSLINFPEINSEGLTQQEKAKILAATLHVIILLKGQKDYILSSGNESCVEGGNAGMTKGGTGDVLAGLVAALACKNNPYSAAVAGSFINKRAGEDLYQTMGPFFNATDLANQIPKTMKELLSL